VVCAGWGTIPLLLRHIDLPPTAVVFARVWVAVPLLAAAVAVDRRRSPAVVEAPAETTGARGAVPWKPALAAGALLAVHWTAMFAGYQHAPADEVVFVVFLAPVGIAALAPVLLGERLDRRTVVALALAVAGFALVAGPALEPGTGVGLAWAALSAATFVGLVLVSKSLAPRLGGLRLNLLEMAVAGVLLVPAALAADWTGLSAAWPWLVVLGAVHTALGITLYLAALAVVPATHVGILGYVEPVSVVALSWVVLGERPALTTAVGGALVIAAGALVVLRSTTAAAPSPPAAPATVEVPAHVPG
jgi:drug/metabolite transporter (DMT)-like permease